jgi:hypothetical protein
MAANIHGLMVYSFEKPMWHNITEPSLEPMTAEEILLKRFGGGFSIELRELSAFLNGEMQKTGGYAIVRTASPYDQKEVVFNNCSKRFHPLQPKDIAKSFDTNVIEPVETMAFLGDGEEMFLSWRMPSCEVVKNDVVEFYGIIRCGFDTLKGARLLTSVFRPVCSNTIALAQGWANQHTDGKSKGNIWKGKASSLNLLRDLGYWMSHIQTNAIKEVNLTSGFFQKLAKTPIKNDVQAQGILSKAYPEKMDNSEFIPVPLRQANSEKIEEWNETNKEIREGIFSLFAGAGTGITNDLWGMLNSTSEYFCHVQPSKRPIAESVMFGGRQKKIMDMVEVLKVASK